MLPTVLGLLSGAFSTFFYPNPQTSLLEHILVDTHGGYMLRGSWMRSLPAVSAFWLKQLIVSRAQALI